jgi:Na+/H+-dicarboxylate symporter
MVKPLGNLFLSLLFMVVVPIVFSSLFLGVAGLGSVQKLGSLGGRTLLWFLGTTALAVLLGIVLVRVIEPGKAVSLEVAAADPAQYLGDAQAKHRAGQAGQGLAGDARRHRAAQRGRRGGRQQARCSG